MKTISACWDTVKRQIVTGRRFLRMTLVALSFSNVNDNHAEPGRPIPGRRGKTMNIKPGMMNIKPGTKYRGNTNGAVVEIVNADDKSVTYKDAKSGSVFTVGLKMFEHLDIAEIEE